MKTNWANQETDSLQLYNNVGYIITNVTNQVFLNIWDVQYIFLFREFHLTVDNVCLILTDFPWFALVTLFILKY